MDKQDNETNQFSFDSTQLGKEFNQSEENHLSKLYSNLKDDQAEDFRIKSMQLLGWSNRDFINKLSGFAEVTESEIMVINLISENL